MVILDHSEAYMKLVWTFHETSCKNVNTQTCTYCTPCVTRQLLFYLESNSVLTLTKRAQTDILLADVLALFNCAVHDSGQPVLLHWIRVICRSDLFMDLFIYVHYLDRGGH